MIRFDLFTTIKTIWDSITYEKINLKTGHPFDELMKKILIPITKDVKKY